jgi:MYXO-CTERM domain-containing protein
MAAWLCCAALLAACEPQTPEPAQVRSTPLRLSREGRYLVLFDRPARAALTERAGAAVRRRFATLPALAITATPRVAEALHAQPWVRAIDPDEGGAGQLLEALPLVGLDAVRSAGFDGTGITVAVIDSGIDSAHPDLAGTVIDEACFCGNNCCPGGVATAHGPGSALDDNGHGTHVASTIAGQGVLGPRGGAPGAKLVAVKVLDQNLGFCCMSDVVAALDWIATEHPEVDVVNLSLGGIQLYAGDCDALNGALGASIDALRAQDVLVFAASGNDHSATSMRAPACIASTLSVGAVWDADVGAQSEYCVEPTTAADQVACYSNASATTDLLAPGGVVFASWRLGSTASRSGTSHAAPVASACAAALREAAPDRDADELEALLEATGRILTDPKNGTRYPRIDCASALSTLIGVADAGAEDDAGMAAEDEDGGTADAAIPEAGTGGSGAAGGRGGEEAGSGSAGTPSVAGQDAGSAGGTEPNARAGSGAGGSATRDAGSAPVADAGHADAGIDELRGGGCACSAGGHERVDVAWVLIGLFAAYGLRRRRA